MKIRNGFVSNSSSASFIVAVKLQEKCPHCGRSDLNFLDLVETIGAKADYEDTELKSRGAQKIWDRLESEILPYCADEEKKEWEKIFGIMVEAEHKGYEVGEVEISYHDRNTEGLLKDLEARKSLVVINCDHWQVKPENIKL